MFDLIFSADAWISLFTLTALEIVLGIDNIIFLSLTANRLPERRRPAARKIGLMLALGLRIVLLASVVWITKLSEPLFIVFGEDFSWKDIVFLAGGMFLLTKSTRDIHGLVEGEESEHHGRGATMLSVIAQIAMFDIVFSVDSVVTAVGVAEHLPVMIAAVVIAMLVMMLASNSVADFVEKHPTVKMLALSFLLLIGTSLIADAMHFHIPRGYLYFAVAFSGMVEFLNQRVASHKAKRATKKP
jgi:predicted tellurium resistance membrane protein TerC